MKRSNLWNMPVLFGLLFLLIIGIGSGCSNEFTTLRMKATSVRVDSSYHHYNTFVGEGYIVEARFEPWMSKLIIPSNEYDVICIKYKVFDSVYLYGVFVDSLVLNPINLPTLNKMKKGKYE